MPRPTALSKVSTAALQAEIERRVSRMASLLEMRERVDKDIAELQAIAAPAASAVKSVRRRRRRKAKAAKIVAKPVAKKPHKAFKQTAQNFILRLLKAGPMTTAQLNERWTRIGRGGKADKALGEMVTAGKIKRAKLKVGKGSEYSLA